MTFSQSLNFNFLRIPFCELAWALSDEAFLSVQRKIEEYPFEYTSYDNILFSLRWSLIVRLSKVILPSFTCEMALSKASGELKATNSRNRYLEFVNLAQKDDFLKKHFDRYPLLLEYIEKTITAWKDAVLIFFKHLLEDFYAIKDVFLDNKSSKIHNIFMDLSDPHHFGRTVFQVEFENCKLIYKPRNLKIESSFNKLLREINGLKFSLLLKEVQVLSKEDHGWMEFIEHESCQTEQEVKNFFSRSGVNLFLWYLLEGTDAHYENIISCGQYPILIDLETLFHPEFNLKSKKINPFKNSVLRTGLLPFIDKTYQRNYGGITAGQNELIPETFCDWININTDSMQIVQKTDSVRSHKHLAHFNQTSSSFTDYIEDICEGFNAIFSLFSKHKEHFLQSFAMQELLSSKVRIVLRGTYFYGRLKEALYLPMHLQSKETREEFFQKMLILYPEDIQNQERKQLIQLDIPYFYSFPNSKNLYASNGECFENALTYSCGDLVKAKILGLNEKEQTKQQKLLKRTLTSFLPQKKGRKNVAFKKTGLEVARLIGEKIWSQQNLLRGDIYNGQLGNAIFFAAMYQATSEEKWAKIAIQFISDGLVNQESLCAFSGFGSSIYAYLILGQLLKKEAIFNQCLELAKSSENRIKKCDRLDFVGGLSGFTTLLLSCYKALKNKQFLLLAIKCGDCLLTKFKDEKKSQIGFSHGLSGYAHALMQLYIHTKKQHYLSFAKEMMRLERSIYCDSSCVIQKNSWCHGLTGIGLSRLSTLPWFDDESARKELQFAVEKTKESIGDESSLCCGDFGRFEFLLEFAQKEKSFSLEMDVKRLIFCHMNEYIRTSGENLSLKNGYQCGFMQGIAGIGYSLLRLTGVCKLPQVLLLEELES